MGDVAALTYLADAEQVGRAVGYLIFPVAGLVMVVVGIVLLVRARRTPKIPPGYRPPGYYLPPGYGPPPGYYPPPGYGPPPVYYPPPVPRPRGKLTGTILLVVGGVIVVGTLVLSVERVGHEVTALAVGNCAAAVGQSPADFKPISCDDPKAVVEVASRSDSNTCPDGKRAGTGESDYGNITDGSTAYCFLPNLKEGSCYLIDTTGEEIKATSCSASAALRIAKRVDGSTDESVCPAGSKPLTYSTPPRVYCVEKP